MAIKRILVLIIFAMGMVIPCFALVGNEHTRIDSKLLSTIEETFGADSQEAKEIYNYINSSLVDDDFNKSVSNFQKIINYFSNDKSHESIYQKLNEYAKAHQKNGVKNHRDVQHWLINGPIPFNQGNLKDFLDQFSPEEQKEIKKMVIELRNTKLDYIAERIQKVFHKLNGHPEKARALAGVIVDVHLIADSMSVNTRLESIPEFRVLKKNLIKNAIVLFGNTKEGKEKAKEFIEKLNKIKTPDDLVKVMSKTLNINENDLKKMINSEGYNFINTMLAKINKMTNKLSDAGKAGLTSAGTTAALSSVMHGYKWLNNQETACEAMASVVEESVESGASVYVSTAVVQKFGDKYAITVLIDGANHSMNQLAGAAIVNHGLATFCMDGTRSVYHFIKGDIDGLQFTRDIAKAGGRAAVSGACAAVSVCIATTVGGPVILAIVPYGGLNAIATVGGWVGGLIFDNVISKAPVFEKLTKDNYFFIEDVLGNLPLSIQHKITAFDSEELRLSPTIFDDDFMNKPTGFDNDLRLSPTIFDDDYGKHKPTAFDTEDWIIRNGHLESKDGKRLTGNEF